MIYTTFSGVIWSTQTEVLLALPGTWPALFGIAEYIIHIHLGLLAPHLFLGSGALVLECLTHAHVQNDLFICAT